MIMAERPMYSEVRAWFTMYSPDFDTDDFISQTGIVPSYQWSMGDKLRAGTRVHKNSGIEVQSTLDKSSKLEDHFKALLQLLREKSDILAILSKKYKTEMDFLGDVWSYNGDRPELVFSKDVVKDISKIGASIGIDLYVVGDED